MFAKIIGAIMLVLGVGLAFSTFKDVLVGAVAFIGMAIVVAWWGVWHILGGLGAAFVFTRRPLPAAEAEQARSDDERNKP